MTSVSLNGVSKRYPNGHEAVRAVDLDVAPGELIALLGPSGCGKSTTLRMVAGLEEITAGELRIGGERVNERAPKDRGVGMVFQSYALYPHMTAFDNIAFALTLQRLPAAEIEARVRDVARRLEISDLLPRRPKQMSGGQRQRVAIARALARRPRVLLFDEPLSNLDAQLRAQMRVELSRLHAELGATSLYVTHDQVEAMTLASRVVLMRAGVVQQVGAPLDLHDHPRNRFVARFIGSPAMNLWRGRLEAGAGAGEAGAGEAGVGEGAAVVLGAEAGAALALPLPPAARAALAARPALPEALEVGVRPHEVRLGAPAEGAWRAVVEVVEALGGESLLHCVALSAGGAPAGVRVVARVEGRPPAARGEVVGLSFPSSALRWFWADEEGESLT
ncbi:MAG: ATP-binding cassette domain-containing protein [Deltaproteobacteria bacterium]|nr:ATP-binding cassette domain-containing protein [Deltaproteobacteria bacterium]